MKNKLYAMLPEAAIEWEQRKAEALARMPRAELREETKQGISDYMEESREFIRQYLSMFFNQRRPLSVVNGVAHIHVVGYLGGRLSFIEKCMGASDYGDISADIEAAMADPSIKAVLIESESGGGSAGGCMEVGELLAELSEKKETALFTDSYCCSAAYAIGVSATRRYASPSAIVGSIGTIMTFFDFEKMLDSAGIRAHIVNNSEADLKAAGNQFRKPTDAEMKHVQELADEFAAQFTGHVVSQNPDIDIEEGFRGQGVSGRDAVKIGFIHATRTRAEVIADLEAWAAVS